MSRNDETDVTVFCPLCKQATEGLPDTPDALAFRCGLLEASLIRLTGVLERYEKTLPVGVVTAKDALVATLIRSEAMTAEFLQKIGAGGQARKEG